MTTVALLSIDNTRTFEDASLQELYVPQGELAAIGTKKALDICKQYGVLLVNVFDKHAKGHISFASSYTDKKPFDFIKYQEIQHRTDEENGLSASAQFSVAQLKTYLLNSPDQTNQVRPDHAKDWTESMDLMPPLTQEMFDINLPKGDKIDEHPYGGFPGTWLEEKLRAHQIQTNIVVGVATDYCSGQSAIESVKAGFETYFAVDAAAPFDPAAGEKMLTHLKNIGVQVITIDQLTDILKAKTNNI
jgi:nicotinamidase-related amidase